MNITLYDGETRQTITGDELRARLASEDGTLWVDLTGPSDEEVTLMRSTFHFHPLAIEDTRNYRQRPKVEAYPDVLFIILNPVALVTRQPEFRELDVFVGRNFVVTVHPADEPVIEEAQNRIDRSGAAPLISPGYLLYVLLDAVVDGYFPVLDAMEEEIENLGDQILTNPQRSALTRLFELKTSLVDMWRVVWPQREILNQLMDRSLGIIEQEPLRPYLHDVYDHLMWIADMVSTFRDTLTSIMDLYMSAVSYRLNIVVNRLTVFTVIIGVLTVIGGFYGMNFEHTWPPFAAGAGIPFVLAVMGCVTAGLLVVFRRLGWY